jgi:integrase
VNAKAVRRKNGMRGWCFRYTDPITHKPSHKTILIANRRHAEKEMSLYLEMLSNRRYNVNDGAGWETSYAELCKQFLEGYPFASQSRRDHAEAVLDRNLLNLSIAGELQDTAALTARALKLVSKGVISDFYSRHDVQGLLKQMTKWAKSAHLIPLDPLSGWKALPFKGHAVTREAFDASEVVALLRAAAEWDQLCHRAGSLSTLIILTLLGTGNRPGAVFKATVQDLFRVTQGWKIRLPEGKGKKFNGAAMIPAELATLLQMDIARRNAKPSDPLLASPQNEFLDVGNVFKRCFLPALCLSIVKSNWPDEVPENIDPADVSFAIARGILKGDDGAPPRDREKLRERALKAELVAKLANDLKPVVERVRRGRTMYNLRHTHQTWAEAANVAPGNIDIQIGHSSRGSGAQSYRAANLMNPLSSAQAVWDYLTAALKPIAEPLRAAVGAEADLVTKFVTSFQATKNGAEFAPLQGTVKNEVMMVEDTGIEPVTFRLPVYANENDQRGPINLNTALQKTLPQSQSSPSRPVTAPNVAERVTKFVTNFQNVEAHAFQMRGLESFARLDAEALLDEALKKGKQ